MQDFETTDKEAPEYQVFWSPDVDEEELLATRYVVCGMLFSTEEPVA